MTTCVFVIERLRFSFLFLQIRVEILQMWLLERSRSILPRSAASQVLRQRHPVSIYLKTNTVSLLQCCLSFPESIFIPPQVRLPCEVEHRWTFECVFFCILTCTLSRPPSEATTLPSWWHHLSNCIFSTSPAEKGRGRSRRLLTATCCLFLFFFFVVVLTIVLWLSWAQPLFKPRNLSFTYSPLSPPLALRPYSAAPTICAQTNSGQGNRGRVVAVGGVGVEWRVKGRPCGGWKTTLSRIFHFGRRVEGLAGRPGQGFQTVTA